MLRRSEREEPGEGHNISRMPTSEGSFLYFASADQRSLTEDEDEQGHARVIADVLTQIPVQPAFWEAESCGLNVNIFHWLVFEP